MNFLKTLKRVTGANKASSAGQSSPTVSANWAAWSGKAKDISKADINVGRHRSKVLKVTQARLMSGGKRRKPCYTICSNLILLALSDLGQGLAEIVDGFVSKVRTVGDTMTSGQLKKQDPATLSAENKKAFKDLQTQVKVKDQS